MRQALLTEHPGDVHPEDSCKAPRGQGIALAELMHALPFAMVQAFCLATTVSAVDTIVDSIDLKRDLKFDDNGVFYALVFVGLTFLLTIIFTQALPRNAPIRGVFKHTLESLCVIGWLGGVIRVCIWLANRSDETYTYPNLVVPYYITTALFALSPISFSMLCWHNMDTAVIGLLARQLQFWLVCLLVFAVIVFKSWGHNFRFDWVAYSLLIFSPLIMALFLDGIIEQSRAFRIFLPLLYLFWVIIEIWWYGYSEDFRPTKLGGNGTVTRDVFYAPSMTDSGQISARLSTILLLMSQFLWHALTDPSGIYISWPLADRIRVRKTDAKLVETGRFGVDLKDHHFSVSLREGVLELEALAMWQRNRELENELELMREQLQQARLDSSASSRAPVLGQQMANVDGDASAKDPASPEFST
jgi:hypothetical protein